MRAWVLRLVFLSAFSSRLGAELDHLVGLHFHGELELEHSASGQYVRHSQHVARASVRVWAVRGCAAAAYLREHVLGDLDDVLGQDLGIDVRNGPTFGRLSQKTILRSYFSQTAAMTSCDLKSFMYSALTCSTLVMPASAPPSNIFLKRTGMIMTRSLPAFLESFSSARQRGVYAHEWCGSAAPR